MIRSWPTRDGWIALALALALAQVGALGGNNLVVLVGCVGLGALWVDLAAGRWNLRGVRVSWRLPAELFAGVPCRGAFVIANDRPRGAVGRLRVDDGVAAVDVEGLRAGEEREVRAWWRFPRRGRATLDGIALDSTWPFGFLQHRRRLAGDAELLVYPRPSAGLSVAGGASDGGGQTGGRPDPVGDFRELRPYRAGDRPGSVHARTSARVGRPMVVERDGERRAGARIVVRVDVEPERELERATGAVLDAFGRGLDVSLALPGSPELDAPASGPRWRRSLLGALALWAPR